jgi:outer membrane protein
VIAGRNDLRATEASVFTQAVTAYLDVIRTEAIVR